ncbi:site-specific integrase [Piscirickettsiaceae bacterium NZ-RLO2]|uniref:tyrosine-type recombinase/integrase n=1 Tax=Piscirickettsia salmonis TaxID=1238 RepID=UPI000F07314F|nr:site-specific integrase [Piscirickettsiaceae bacterium NZ-RLO2]
MSREGQAKVLTSKEFKRLLNITAQGPYPKRNLALLYISFYLGLRVKEIAALTVGDIQNIETGELHETVNLSSDMTKGGKQRHIYITHAKLVKYLEDYLAELKELARYPYLETAPLFRSRNGNSFSPNSLQQVFARLYQEAGIVGASSHSGRRTYATRLAEKGVDLKALSTLMGHASVQMTARYVSDNPERLKRISTLIDF